MVNFSEHFLIGIFWGGYSVYLVDYEREKEGGRRKRKGERQREWQGRERQKLLLQKSDGERE